MLNTLEKTQLQTGVMGRGWGWRSTDHPELSDCIARGDGGDRSPRKGLWSRWPIRSPPETLSIAMPPLFVTFVFLRNKYQPCGPFSVHNTMDDDRVLLPGNVVPTFYDIKWVI